MGKEIEVKGKNLEEALLLAQKELNTTKENISYEIIEETNKTLFSILTPKYVIIKAKRIEETIQNNVETSKKNNFSEEEKENITKLSLEFLKEFFDKIGVEYTADTTFEENILNINIKSKDAKILIGYRGEVLDALQNIVTISVSNSINANTKIQIDIENYREKRKKILEDLANKVAQNVIRTGKSISLEPMVAFERKIIHLALQDNNKIETMSVGEEPYRKIVIKLKQ